MKQYPSACSEFFISSSIDMEIICTQTFSSRIRRRACGRVEIKKNKNVKKQISFYKYLKYTVI
jgi:hypothetical protein